MIEIILTTLVSLSFILFAVFIILVLSKNTTKGIAEKTIQLVSSYDDLLFEKSKELEKLKGEITYLKEKKGRLLAVGEKGVVLHASNGRKIQKRRQRYSSPSFLADDFCGTYNSIRNNFQFDLKEIAKKHPEISNIAKNQTLGYEKILEEVDFETFYSLSFLQESEQISCISECFPESSKEILSAYQEKSNSFNSLDFYTYLCDMRENDKQYAKITVSPTVEIPEDLDFDVVVDEGICEGIQVEINHKLFDYSINKKEIDANVNNK